MFDKDILKDDFMGEVTMSLAVFPPNQHHVINLELHDGGDHYLKKKIKRGKKLGTMRVSFYFYYASNSSELERCLDTNGHSEVSSVTSSRKGMKKSASTTVKIKRKKSIVNIMVVEAKNLKAVDWNNNTSDPTCKINIGKEKFKTSTKYKTVNPVWKESFSIGWDEASCTSPLAILIMSGRNLYHYCKTFTPILS